MSRKKPTRRDVKAAKAMNARKTASGGACGWLPQGVDQDLAFKQLFIHAHTGGYVDGAFAGLTKLARAEAGAAGAKSGAVELPDALFSVVVDVIVAPPLCRKDILNAMREAIDAEILSGARGAGVHSFKRWYHGQNRRRDAKFSAMLARSIPDFADWLETFPE